VKKTAPSIKNNLSDMIQDILQEKATILELSRKWNFPPYLLARSILETTVDFTTVGETKKQMLSDLLHYPQKLKDMSLLPMYQSVRLSAHTLLERQSKEALDADPMYGVKSDRDRHLVGIEYEIVLEYYLNCMSKRELVLNFP
jgi:hypothetical protein